MSKESRKQEIEKLVALFKEEESYFPDTGFLMHFKKDWDRLVAQGLIKDRRVIDIGCGERADLLYFAMESGASEYVGVEPCGAPKRTVFSLYGMALHHLEEHLKHHPEQKDKASVIGQDGLEYLASQPDNSAIVVSFGVFVRDQPFGHISQEDVDEYMKLFSEEVARVTPKGDITIHYPYFEYGHFLEKAGFEPFMEAESVASEREDIGYTLGPAMAVWRKL